MESKRERIKRHAIILFASRGIRDTTIRDIATSLDIALGGIYYYYKSKGHLLEEIMKDFANNREEFLNNIQSWNIPFEMKIKLLLTRRLNLRKDKFSLYLFAKIFDNGETSMTFDEYLKRDQIFEIFLQMNIDEIAPEYRDELPKIGRFLSTAFTKLLLMLIEETGIEVNDTESYDRMVDTFHDNVDIKKEVDLFYNLSFKELLNK